MEVGRLCVFKQWGIVCFGSRERVWGKVKPEKKAGARPQRAYHAIELGSDPQDGIMEAMKNGSH